MEHLDLDKLIDRQITNSLGRHIISHALADMYIDESSIEILKFCGRKSIDPRYVYMFFFKSDRLAPGTLTERRIKFLKKLDGLFAQSSKTFEIPVSKLNLMLGKFNTWWQDLGQIANSGKNESVSIDYSSAYKAVTEFLGENPNTWWKDKQTRLARLIVLYVAYLTVRNRHKQFFHVSSVAAA